MSVRGEREKDLSASLFNST